MMYTPQAMKERKKLRASKVVRGEVKQWWYGLGKDMVKGLTRDEYIGLYLNLAPVGWPPSAMRQRDDRSSGGRTFMGEH